MTNDPTPEGVLALVAGTGDLPRLIAEDRRRRDLPLLIVRFEGSHLPWAEGMDVLDLPFEKPGRLFKALKAKGCTSICFAGAMVRPKLDPLRLDFKGVTLLPKVLRLLKQGDDNMLRGFAQILADEGYPLIAPHELLAGLLASTGALGVHRPSEQDFADAARGAEIARALGAADIGQAAVVADGLCLGVEAIAGTDALLSEVSRLPETLRPADAGGVLFKSPKPGQDWRVDLPAIGPETVRRAAEARLAGLFLAKGGVLVLGLEATIAAADEAGLFLWGWAEGDGMAAPVTGPDEAAQGESPAP